jgi:hypothetical protein
MRCAEQEVPSSGECGIVTALAELPATAIISEKALADIFSCSPTTIKRAVERGELPLPIRMFAKPTWTVGAIIGHVNARLENARKEHEDEMRRLSLYSEQDAV